MRKYVYPALSDKDFSFFRLGGPGLANCMFVAARAYLRATDTGAELLRPTWERLGIGQWLRRETDKRFYVGLFKGHSLWECLRKFFLIRFSRNVEKIDGLEDYFGTILSRQHEVVEYFTATIEPDAIKDVPDSLSKVIGVHVRMGDYPAHFRVPIAWYRAVIQLVREELGYDVDVQILSDGTDEELHELLELRNVRRTFYGNALADIVALSRCGLVIGSDSTFSGWAVFLGQVPAIFYRIHYLPSGGLLRNSSKLMVSTDVVPSGMLTTLLKSTGLAKEV